MTQIDFGNPMERAIAALTCGENTLPADGGVRDVTRDCEAAVRVIEGALSRYCGCPCRHPDDPICDPGALPEDRARLLPRLFSGFRPGDPDNADLESRAGMRDILAGGDMEFENSSFVYAFGYCPEEVPDAWDTLMSEHRLPAPADTEICRPEVTIDEDLLNRPAGLWLELAAKIGMLSYDTFQQPWTIDLALGGQALNGFYGLFGGRVAFMPTVPQTLLGESSRSAGTVYGAMGFVDVGYYFVISSTFGLRLFADFDVGSYWAEEEVQVSPGNWTEDMGEELQFHIGPGLKLMIWPIEGFTMGLGLTYSATVTDTPLPRHSFLFSLDMAFRLMSF